MITRRLVIQSISACAVKVAEGDKNIGGEKVDVEALIKMLAEALHSSSNKKWEVTYDQANGFIIFVER